MPARTGEQFLRGLRDSRQLWLGGQRVTDPLDHPDLRGAAQAIAAVFEVDFGALREAHMGPPIEPSVQQPVDRAVSAEEALALAKVRRIKRYYLQVVESILIVGFLAVVNVLSTPRHLWVFWVAIPWALALALQGLRIFDKVPFLNGDWERRTVEKYLGRKL